MTASAWYQSFQSHFCGHIWLVSHRGLDRLVLCQSSKLRIVLSRAKSLS